MTFHEELEHIINKYSQENVSNTPDYILANFILGCMKAFDQAVKDRDKWYHNGEIMCPGKPRSHKFMRNGG